MLNLNNSTHMKQTIAQSARKERWKLFPLKRISKDLLEQTISPVSAEKADSTDLHLDAYLKGKIQRIVYIDGALSDTHTTLTDVESVKITQTNGAQILEFKDNTVLDFVTYIIHFYTNKNPSLLPKFLYQFGKQSEVNIVEEIYSLNIGHGDQFLRKPHYQIQVAQQAKIGHYFTQNDDMKAFQLNKMQIQIQESSSYQQFILSLGCAACRFEIDVDLCGKNINCHISGAYLAQENQHLETITQINHLAPHSQSRQVYKGIATDQAHHVYMGKIYVDQLAQKTDGYQLSKSLLLSEQAQVNTKPELEIYADDVKCSHGATIGDLDQNELFYLMSRGLSKDQAEYMLIQGFLKDALDEIQHQEIRLLFENKMNSQLETIKISES